MQSALAAASSGEGDPQIRDRLEQLRAEAEQPLVGPADPIDERTRHAAVEFNGHHFARVEQKMTVAQAASYCQRVDGHLVRIETAAEQQFVARLVATGADRTCWIDGSDAVSEGAWQFGDGRQMSCANWSPNEPNGGRGEHAVVMSRDGRWSDVNSSRRTAFVCEWED